MTTAWPSPRRKAGAAKIRINPGNIGGEDRVRAVVDCCRMHKIPIRIGVNGGSLERRLLEKYGHVTAEALIESAFSHLALLEKFGFYDTCVSMKSSNVPMMMAAYRSFAAQSDYPLHVGVTETGTPAQGVLKSAIGIGGLLPGHRRYDPRLSDGRSGAGGPRGQAHSQGGGSAPHRRQILIACPTCGRTSIDLIGLANQVEQALADCEKEITVAVMGCVVNGPGEAREADVGIAGGDGCGVLFVKGELKERLPYDQLLPALLAYIDKL